MLLLMSLLLLLLLEPPLYPLAVALGPVGKPCRQLNSSIGRPSDDVTLSLSRARARGANELGPCK